jgi:hypothetical protein
MHNVDQLLLHAQVRLELVQLVQQLEFVVQLVQQLEFVVQFVQQLEFVMQQLNLVVQQDLVVQQFDHLHQHLHLDCLVLHNLQCLHHLSPFVQVFFFR